MIKKYENQIFQIMNIFKAIKQEKKANKHFYIIMISLAIILPLAIYLTALTSWFYLTYLFIMEFLIMTHLKEIEIQLKHF